LDEYAFRVARDLCRDQADEAALLPRGSRPKPRAGRAVAPVSNYRSFYGRPSWASAEDLTPRQYRRGARKTERDLLAGAEPARHPNRGRGLSGHPGRRREQLAQREALAGFRYLAAVRRRLDTAAKPAGPPVDKRRSVQLQELIVRRPS
jgi:hypothetical protein